MPFNKQWVLWLLALTFISLCVGSWLFYPAHAIIDNKDFTVLDTELPVMPVQIESVSPYTPPHIISDYIWHHAQQELWLCGSLTDMPHAGIFKLVQGQGKQQHLLQQGRYQLRAIHDQTGELWLMNEDGQVTKHQWQALPTRDGRRSMQLDSQHYVARTLTSMESTCPMPTQKVAQLAF